MMRLLNFTTNFKEKKMRCDSCGRNTEKNYFTDNLTILCKDCATAGGYYAGDDARQYIKVKTQQKLF